MKAIIAEALDEFGLAEVDLDMPEAGEVLIKMKATGVCHSDLSVVNGTIATPMPVALGHEGAGIVEGVGPGVTNVEPGDHVAISFVPCCGSCFHCLRRESYLCNASPEDGCLFDGTTRVHRDGSRRKRGQADPFQDRRPRGRLCVRERWHRQARRGVKASRRGGHIVIVGIGRLEDKYSICHPIMVFTSKTLKGTNYGGTNFRTDFPMYLDLYRQGKLELDALVSKTYRLEDAVEAFDDLEKGVNARGVIVHD